MAGSRRGVRLFAMGAGLALSLVGAALLAGPASPDDELVGNEKAKVYHKASCALVAKIAEASKVELISVDEARVQGFKPCSVCKPAGDLSRKAAAKPRDDDSDDAPAEKKPSARGRSRRSSGKAARRPAPEGDEAKADDGSMKADGKAKGKRGTSARGAAASKKADAKSEAATAPAADDSAVKFSRDIAPILAGNCTSCHNPQRRRGQFDLSNFDKLMAGSKRKVIAPGKPDESELVLRIRGESDGPKMPPGQTNLAPETIAKIEEWIKAGARLDAGIDPKANLDTIAPTPEARRKAEMARLSPEQRDKKAEEAALERWKKASAKDTPVMASGKNFLVFSKLPKDRAERLLKAMEGQRTALGNLLGPAAGALTGSEKISLYVFNDLPTYVEFCRSVESREVETGIEAHGKLDVEQPYLVAVDPLGGHEETTSSGGTATKKSSRSKKAQAEEPPDGPDRTLAGLLSEQLASSALVAGGKPPRWLVYGLGAYFGETVDPRGSNYYRKLHEKAAEQLAIGWPAKANEALGSEGEPETLRAMGLTLCEWMATALRPQFPSFVRGLSEVGGEKLDDVIRGCFGQEVTREQFLEQWGNYVAARYGRRR